MGRPPVKRERAMIKAKLTAEAKFSKTPLGRELWLREQVEKLIDKIDPLELAAVVTGTFVIYDLIKSIPEMLAQARITALVSISPFLAIIIDRLFGGLELTNEQKAEIEAIKNTPDFMLFAKSFVLSYMMVKHSGQIISGVGNLTSFVAGMLGMKAV